MNFLFIENFPTAYEPRSTQIEIIKDIESFIKSGYQNILVCAPTGVGKSHVTITIAKSLGSSFILTGQKMLQDQYTNDFSWVYPMKGKNNFPCMALYDEKKVKLDDSSNDENLTCDKGTCSWKPKGLKKIEYCKFKPQQSQFNVKQFGTEKESVTSPKDMCYYYNQKFQALHASHSVFNYSSFFQTKKYNSGIEDLLEKKCLIADESHEIENELIRFIGYNIRKSYLDDVDWTYTPYDLEDIDSVLKLVNDLYIRYIEEVKAFEEYQSNSPKLAKFKRREEKLGSLIGDMGKDIKNFIVQPDNPDPSKTNVVSIKPLNIRNYVKDFFDFKIQLFLSATIEKKTFCNNMGFKEDDCAFLEIPKSPFPKENRAVQFLNIQKMNNRSTEEDWSKIYQRIDKLMKKHSTEKGLILTSSIAQCEKIKKNVSPDSSKRLLSVYSEKGKKREDVLEKHKLMSSPTVLISPSLWVGVDLKDDLSRFQIVVKTPYLSLSDKRIRIKMEANHTWYRHETLMKLLQGFGRSVRHKDDKAITYVLDSSAEQLIKSMKNYVPKSYFDVLGLN